jgi:hypothetical protein
MAGIRLMSVISKAEDHEQKLMTSDLLKTSLLQEFATRARDFAAGRDLAPRTPAATFGVRRGRAG